ncbi:MAG: hypothetical protein JNM27_14675 [Leptospirales bacterium]|nr:hypothetical protein [Leptospirales bacterium]
MKTTLIIAGTTLVGVYLAFVPLLQAIFPEHRSICPCHNSVQVVKVRVERLVSLALGEK